MNYNLLNNNNFNINYFIAFRKVISNTHFTNFKNNKLNKKKNLA